jgi:hypothetical protein
MITNIGPPKEACRWSNKKLKTWYIFFFGELPKDWREGVKLPSNKLTYSAKILLGFHNVQETKN